MPNRLHLAFEVLLCALIAVLIWKNGQMQTRVNELETSLSATGELLWEAQAKAPVANVKSDLPDQEKRELMRLRGEVTALKTIAAEAERASLLAAKRAMEVSSQFSDVINPEPNANADNEPPTKPASVVTWTKVKIDQAGVVTVAENALGSEAFAAECERVKNANGAFILSIDTTDGVLNPAQIEALQRLHKAGVPIHGNRPHRNILRSW